jgi:hypothetical protein
MMSCKLIGIHGPLNGGKDTIANFIVNMDKSVSRPPRWKRYAFAKPIKEASKAIFGFSDEQLEDRVLKEAVDPFWGFTPRKIFQLLGAEFGRNMICDDIWIRRAKLEILNNSIEGIGTIITDVRYQNEADWLREQGAMLIYIKVPNLIRDEKYQHSSEAGITEADTDFVIINDKSLGLNNLYNQIEELLIKWNVSSRWCKNGSDCLDLECKDFH